MDKRREFISGFSGSAGWAVITATEQAVWTDSRYFLQSDQQLDCNWYLMRDGLSGVSIKYNGVAIYFFF
jgi:Xaa-Pro aminopeptidase